MAMEFERKKYTNFIALIKIPHMILDPDMISTINRDGEMRQ